MTEVRPRHFLPALMGSLHQQKAEGELVLEQNDGTRRLYWSGGELKNLRSDAVGEQFGNFLIRRGVLDMNSLKELLADGENARVGDRVVQWGLMTKGERDERLGELMGSVLLHAMEHPILRMSWIPGPLDPYLSGDLQFRLEHRTLVWSIFQSAKIDKELVAMFRSEPNWLWKARPNLLEALTDLPLTPTLAYALTLLGTEPLGFVTMTSLTGLPAEEAARLVATLWAVGGLSLAQGEVPLAAKVLSQPTPTSLPELEPAIELELEPEIEISLVEEDDPHDQHDSHDPHEPAPRSAPAPRPMSLMDVLEMDFSGTARDFPSPAGPPPNRDPFSPTVTPPPPLPPAPPVQSDPFSHSAPQSSRTPFSPGAIPPPVRPPVPPPPPPSPAPTLSPYALPELDTSGTDGVGLPPEDESLPPQERAHRLVVKAKSYMMQSRTSEASRALEQALKLDGESPGAFETWMLLGKLRLSNPAWSTRSIEALQMASRLNPKAAEPWALMGELYHRKGFHANAQGCLRRALELDPSVAMPPGWAPENSPQLPNKDSSNGLMGMLRGMFGKG